MTNAPYEIISNDLLEEYYEENCGKIVRKLKIWKGEKNFKGHQIKSIDLLKKYDNFIILRGYSNLDEKYDDYESVYYEDCVGTAQTIDEALGKMFSFMIREMQEAIENNAELLKKYKEYYEFGKILDKEAKSLSHFYSMINIINAVAINTSIII